jgi:hypothetical protein
VGRLALDGGTVDRGRFLSVRRDDGKASSLRAVALVHVAGGGLFVGGTAGCCVPAKTAGRLEGATLGYLGRDGFIARLDSALGPAVSWASWAAVDHGVVTELAGSGEFVAVVGEPWQRTEDAGRLARAGGSQLTVFRAP